jgi:hypothetical protein
MFKCRILLLHIQVVLGSNTHPETVYPKEFRVPSQAKRQLLGQNPTITSEHIAPLITTWGHIKNSYRSTTSMPCSSCYASHFSVLLYISQSVHINICNDNNMISSSRYKCCQLFHMCWREIQQPTYREKSWIPPCSPSTAFPAYPQYSHLLFNAEYSAIMPVSLNISYIQICK